MLPFILHGNIYTYDELKATYNVNINFLQYSVMVKSVLDWKKKINLVSTKNKMTNPILPLLLQIKNKKGTQAMYKLLSENNDTPTGKIAWNKKYRFDENEWKIIYTESFKITKDSTVQWYQTRINHKILATNTFLCKIKETNDPKCTFCSKEDETIEHVLWECNCVKKFINEITTWLSQHNIHITLDEKSFLFGQLPNQESEANKLVLMEMKYYIYIMQDVE